MKLEEARVHYISQNHQIGEVGHKITQAVITFVIDKELTSQESHFIDNLKNKEVKLIIEEKKPILDDEEKRYLSGVIKPFKNKMENLKFEVSKETKAINLYNFITNNMSFIEVVELFKLLTNKMKETLDFVNEGGKE